MITWRVVTGVVVTGGVISKGCGINIAKDREKTPARLLGVWWAYVCLCEGGCKKGVWLS